ncbi:hypothetical protein ACHAWC_004459 [Mediolabrus comicus]
MTKAELILSRSSYRAGTPVVGTVRIHRSPPPSAHANNNPDSLQHDGSPHSIRDEVLSARLYLAGRSYLGNKQKVSKWRSTQEISNLFKLYGEDGHACLRMAKMEEMAVWKRDQNDNFSDNEADLPVSDDNREERVTYIEQAERFAIHSHLRPKYNHVTTEKANNGGDKDYSNLPTSQENNTICFFMTNVLDLLALPERDENFDGFQPLQLPDLDVFRALQNRKDNDNHGMDEDYTCVDETKQKPHYDDPNHSLVGECPKKGFRQYKGGDTATSLNPWQHIMQSAETSRNRNESSTSDQTQMIMLSFRADLPFDLPPTLTAECVKYFYSAVLVVTTNAGEILVTTCPFSVLTANSPYLNIPNSDRDATATRVHIGELHACAHSSSLPTLISSSDVSTKLSQLNVIANPPVRNILSRRTAEQRTSTHRIQDSNGGLCGWMTLIGFGGPLSPGTSLAVCVEFPTLYNDDDDISSVIGCHRVCCGLVGEEYAICERSGGVSSTPGRPDNPHSTIVRRKTRSYVFDSAYEMVEFGHTNKISMGLVLPSDCPVTVKTDLVEVTVTLKVEFTVDRLISESSSDGVKDTTELGVIRLDVPCEVVHSGIGLNEDMEDTEEGEAAVVISQFWRGAIKRVEPFNDSDLPDLNVLSLEVIKSFT